MRGNGDITAMMKELNEWELRQLVLRMSEQLGERDSLNALNSVVDFQKTYTRESVSRAVNDAMRSMDGIFLSGPVGDLGHCRNPKELALELTMGALNDACRNDVSKLLANGRRLDADRYIRWIAQSLDSVRCAMTEHVPGCGSEVSRWFMENLEAGNPLGGFDY